jgi:hypothetical protein
MELADALWTSGGQPEPARRRRERDSWYDPDSIAFVDVPERAMDGWTRVSDARRQEIAAALPPGLRPLSLLVRVRRDGPTPR